MGGASGRVIMTRPLLHPGAGAGRTGPPSRLIGEAGGGLALPAQMIEGAVPSAETPRRPAQQGAVDELLGGAYRVGTSAPWAR